MNPGDEVVIWGGVDALIIGVHSKVGYVMYEVAYWQGEQLSYIWVDAFMIKPKTTAEKKSIGLPVNRGA